MCRSEQMVNPLPALWHPEGCLGGSGSARLPLSPCHAASALTCACMGCSDRRGQAPGCGGVRTAGGDHGSAPVLGCGWLELWSSLSWDPPPSLQCLSPPCRASPGWAVWCSQQRWELCLARPCLRAGRSVACCPLPTSWHVSLHEPAPAGHGLLFISISSCRCVPEIPLVCFGRGEIRWRA